MTKLYSFWGRVDFGTSWLGDGATGELSWSRVHVSLLPSSPNCQKKKSVTCWSSSWLLQSPYCLRPGINFAIRSVDSIVRVRGGETESRHCGAIQGVGYGLAAWTNCYANRFVHVTAADGQRPIDRLHWPVVKIAVTTTTWSRNYL